ncbi:MAG: hypothetical protein IJ064_06865 [Bacteroidaceae bacterium]|nr:hypothetical protein [Bacteroidaceae bacterium]
MKRILNLFLLIALFLPVSAMADDGKVCPVEGGSVQAEVTNSPIAKIEGPSKFGYDVTFVLMNSSPNFVNATYVLRDTQGKTYKQARVLVVPQKSSEPINVHVTANSGKLTFVVDVIGADCKEK